MHHETAARLQTRSYLEAHTRSLLDEGSGCEPKSMVMHPCKYVVKSKSFSLIKMCRRPRIVFCQGIAARENNFFRNLPLHPARGDILTVASQKLMATNVLHGDTWIAPLKDHRILWGQRMRGLSRRAS